MGLLDFILLVIGTASAIAGGWGFAMLSLSEPRFRAIRGMFLVSGIGFWSLGIVWAVGTAHQPLSVRLAVAGIIGAIAAVGLAYVLIETGMREKLVAEEAKPSNPPSPGKNSPTINAGGNVTIGHIGDITTQPNPPKVEFGQDSVTQRNDGTYDSTIPIILSSQMPVSLLYVSVAGPNVLDFKFEPGMSGVASYWYGKMDDNGAKALGFTNPQIGRYLLTVHTATVPTPSNLRVRWQAQ